MNFVKRGKQECPKCKAMKEKIIENCFVDVYKILCSNKGDIVNKFITRINSIITENSLSKLIENIETEKGKLKSKMNKLIDLSLENIIGGYDEKDKADPKQVTFVLKNESKINYEDYLQTRGGISQKSLQVSDHICGVCGNVEGKIKYK